MIDIEKFEQNIENAQPVYGYWSAVSQTSKVIHLHAEMDYAVREIPGFYYGKWHSVRSSWPRIN
jgi:hypothetical protein